jgi:hypothetical protein
MTMSKIAPVCAALAYTSVALAQIETAPPLPFDAPQTMRAMEAVCTGIGSDARADPRWSAYPLKVEVVGIQGQYLGETQVTVTKGGEAVVSVRCGGPWVLFKIEPGAYGVTAEVGGVSRSARVTVGARGQARVVLRFPGAGGAVSPEFRPQGTGR